MSEFDNEDNEFMHSMFIDVLGINNQELEDKLREKTEEEIQKEEEINLSSLEGITTDLSNLSINDMVAKIGAKTGKKNRQRLNTVTNMINKQQLSTANMNGGEELSAREKLKNIRRGYRTSRTGGVNKIEVEKDLEKELKKNEKRK